MRKIIRQILINASSLYLAGLFINGLKIVGGINSFITGGIIFFLADYILKPILNFISIPFNILTLGLFSSFINAIILYFISLMYSKITVSSFYFQGFSYKNMIIPGFFINTFLSYFIISFIMQVIKQVFVWLIEEK